MRRGVVTAAAVAGALIGAPAAGAEVPSVFDGAVDCTVESDGVRFCGGAQTTVPTFDGVEIDVNVALPPEPESGPDGGYPLMGMFHGWGGSESSLGAMRRFAERGYAVFSMSDRGFGHSCGATSPTRFTPTCITSGYIRLMDTRYEVRDAQEFMGRLVDEGVADPQRIGSIGGSYGGGISMALAALKDRKMLEDGSLVDWTSPEGTPMRIAAATPEIPWTDLAYSLMPNGRTLDYVADAPYGDRVGVMKQSFVSGLYAAGQAAGTYALPGQDPEADLSTWYGLISAGEPYDENPLTTDILDLITKYHSSYYIDTSRQPAPLLISNGWTDDIFPADEAIRFYNRTRSLYPGADISLMFLDYGHQRGQNKEADIALLRAQQDDWLDHYVKGEGPEPDSKVTTLTQTCPATAPSGGPFEAPTWAQIAPGEVRFGDAQSRPIAPSSAADPSIGRAFDPIAGGGACASTDGADIAGSATYRSDPAPAGGFTLMGSPTVVADVLSPVGTSQIAARLTDVAPDGSQTLVARALYRPRTSSEAARQVFQLHPNGWRFEEGHVAKLELLPSDVPYGRVSNGQGPITVANAEIRLPVLEEPGTGPAVEPAPKFLPDGYELAPGYDMTDSDGDGIVDADDSCPDVPGPASNAGCPLPDGDGDGVPDGDDACPDEPGPIANEGCPEGDGDRDDDGVPDIDDACLDDPGPAENAGCPIPPDDDADDDGVLDADDACPDDPGPADNDGCPIEPPTCELEIEGTSGPDELVGTVASELITGLAGDDLLRGRSGPDCLRGGRHDDLLRGGAGDDELKGGAARDRLNGGDGDDLIIAAGTRSDKVRCGEGDDVAVVGREDSVEGCEQVRRG